MSFYENEKGVLEYEAMSDGLDGRELVERLTRHLPAGSTVLELGMGPGKDLDLLAEHYVVTGSDTSKVFLDRYRRRVPDADLLELDAARLDTDRVFDGLYSNKVLHHLTRDQLSRSFARQSSILRPGGIALHSFWFGEHEEEHHGLRFVHYTEDTLPTLMPNELEAIELVRYGELGHEDSLVLVARRTCDRP